MLPVSRGFLRPHGHEILSAYRPEMARCRVGIAPGFRYDAEPGFVPCRMTEIPECQAMLQTVYNEDLVDVNVEDDADHNCL